MRVLLDPNLYISYLLTPTAGSSVSRIIKLAVEADFTLVIPVEALDEVKRKVQEKPYLSERITRDEVEQLLDLLRQIGEVVPELIGPLTPVVQDPKDDYLVAQAIQGRADVVVSGDSHLIELGTHAGIWFTNAAAFVANRLL